MQTILEAGRAEKNYWRDLWRYRELFQVLAWRDLSVRYKQTVIGVAWAVVRPILTMLVSPLVCGRAATLKCQGPPPPPPRVFRGLPPWLFFPPALPDPPIPPPTTPTLSPRFYSPRLIVPTATIVVAFVDFAISFVLLLGMMVIYQFVPPWQIIFIPVFVVLCFLTSLGPGLWITSLNVKYRDFRYVIPFIIQFGLYLTPVGFTKDVILAKIPENLHFVYNMNPMVGVIDGFRWCILGGPPPFLEPAFLIGIGVTIFMLWLGIRQFRKMEKTFADLI
ncbi:MAG: ABC transporter permease [Verrucomicrobiaceae bacterium]|nr:ABC transporter permease [Verrucomicrobiaceae bacterium]